MGKRGRTRRTAKTTPNDEQDDVDLILRHVSRQFPRDVARALLGAAEPIEPLGWVDTQVTGRQRRLDRALAVKVGGEERLLHAEWTLAMSDEMPFRVFEYHCLTALAVADEARAREGAPARQPTPIDSVVVVLSGREEPWPAHSAYRTSSRDEPFSGVQFRIEAVYQRTVAELAARGSPFWLIFAPLAADADGRKLTHVIETLRACSGERQFEELGAAMVALAEADARERGLADVIKSLLPREVVMQNSIYREGKAAGLKEGLEKGLEKGLALLAHQIERRLGRQLTAEERRRLSERMHAEGPEKVGDVVLDLSADDLSMWLTATAS
ncbi:hypothetical protein WME90_14505 [Sorangium sp. So ce375]|uniref:hypothetical protein n=1 Tax=Sorangium sp. So ce375 TaxID=3133306 RepID=UPI003F5C412E